jgi:hypothetical protein
VDVGEKNDGEQEPNNKMSDSGDHPTALTEKKKGGGRAALTKKK